MSDRVRCKVLLGIAAIKGDMKLIAVCLSLFCVAEGAVQLRAYQSGNSGSPCIKDGSSSIRLICTVDPLSQSVRFKKNGVTETQCSNAVDICIPTVSATDPRYTFSSDVSKKEFYFNISAVGDSDKATILCDHGGSESANVSFDDCPPGTTTSSTTTTTITSSTTSMTTSTAIATTTSSLSMSTTSILTSTIETPITFPTATTVTASPTAQSTATVASTKSTEKPLSTSRGTVTTVTHASDRDSDKAIVTMIIVVSVIGGILIVAIFSILFVMMHSKSFFTRKGYSKQTAQRSDHRKHQMHTEYNASGRFLNTQQDHAMRGYYFYYGTHKNPVFYDPFENSSHVNSHSPNQKNSQDPNYMLSHETYQYNYDRDYNGT